MINSSHYAHIKDYVTFSKGTLLFAEGQISSTMYIIVEGEVEVTVNGKWLHNVYAGNVIGELSLIDSRPRSATVTAIADCKVITVDRNRFKEMIKLNPDFAIDVMRILAGRLRELTDGF